MGTYIMRVDQLGQTRLFHLFGYIICVLPVRVRLFPLRIRKQKGVVVPHIGEEQHSGRMIRLSLASNTQTKSLRTELKHGWLSTARQIANACEWITIIINTCITTTTTTHHTSPQKPAMKSEESATPGIRCRMCRTSSRYESLV